MKREEFVSRTQKSVRNISDMALQARVKGMSFVRDGIAFTSAQGKRDLARELITSMNYSVRQCEKELAFRVKSKRK